MHIFAAAVVVGLTCSKRAKKFAHSLVEYNFHHEINGHKIRSKFQNEYDTHRDRSTDDTRNGGGGGGGDSKGVSGGNISNCKRNNDKKKPKREMEMPVTHAFGFVGGTPKHSTNRNKYSELITV